MDTTSTPGAPNAPTNTDLTIGEADAVLTLSEADIVSTPDEAAPSCGFSADTINKAIASGTLAAVRMRADLAERRLADLREALRDMREQRDKWRAVAERLQWAERKRWWSFRRAG